jgi:hypothetical protein
MTERTATCACGQLRATCTGEPARLSVCHCLDCQRRTGSVFAFNATFPAAQVTTSGAHKSFTRSSEDGFWVAHHFCPDCGSTVFYEIERRPGMVSVPVGGFADPTFPEPSISVYRERGHPWVKLDTSRPVEEM